MDRGTSSSLNIVNVNAHQCHIEPMFYKLENKWMIIIISRKSFHLDECNSEISFLSETPGTRRSTPLTSLTSTPQTVARTSAVND